MASANTQIQAYKYWNGLFLRNEVSENLLLERIILPWLIFQAFVTGIIKRAIPYFTISLKFMIWLDFFAHHFFCKCMHACIYLCATHTYLQCINKTNLLHAALITPCDQIPLVATAAAQCFGNRTTPKGKGNLYIFNIFFIKYTQILRSMV